MTPLRWAIVGFWVLVVIGLIWEVNNYDTQLDAKETPVLHNYGPLASMYAPQPLPQTADVQQARYWLTKDSSGQMFTAHLTLTNKGLAKATNVIAKVAPFVGALDYDPDAGATRTNGVIKEDSGLGNISSWLNYPDLASGESATEVFEFSNPSNTVTPAETIHSKINFTSVK